MMVDVTVDSLLFRQSVYNCTSVQLYISVSENLGRLSCLPRRLEGDQAWYTNNFQSDFEQFRGQNMATFFMSSCHPR